ncbi:hypothetical protein GMDG_01920 [Pseudogymnoascus destructans 20631-21]|uniref:alpha-amylase n=1 Tax=Pseudogymnoascus destructans (strain ATCC MYA-4855 / 20631-21) TaxID=658429 RepID=L8FZQ7_PSED2|nr:hypothetical protein GMDG_01920 [Pseudogymnoascus destructans 20631-21]
MHSNLFPATQPASLLLAAISFLPIAAAKTAAEWRELYIYQVLTDRFATTDGSSPSCGITDYCGAFITSTGVLLPAMRIMDMDWADNHYTLRDHFGTTDDLKSLGMLSMGRGMSLMVDVVINHFGANQESGSVDYSAYPSPFNAASAFHPPYASIFGALVDSVIDLVSNYSIDGIRLDTVKHVPKEYLTQFQEAVGVFVTGEALDGDPAYVPGYQGPLNSAINYPLYTEASSFSNVNVLTNFLNNHDQPRIASQSSDDEVRDKNAVTFLMFTSGIPMVYYGFEQRFTSAVDPNNLETLWTSEASNVTDKATYFSSNVAVLGTSNEYMALQRGPVVAVVSNVGAAGTSDSFSVTGSQFSSGDIVVDLLDCATATVGGSGAFTNAEQWQLMSLKLTPLKRVWRWPLYLP